MTKAYYVVFSNNKKPICGCWQRAENPEEAIEIAEWAMICHYSNVKYDDIYITKEEE